MTHDQIASLLGAYALDAVDEDERVLVADHLRDCPRCRAEVAEHQETASRLAFAGSTAPAGLWASVAASLSFEVPSQLSPPRLHPVRRWPAIVAAAAVVAVAFGVLGWQIHTEQNRVRTLSTRVAMTQLSLNPTSTVAQLTSTDHHVVLSVVIGTTGSGFVASNGTLPALAGNATYQLWGLSSSRTVSLGLLGGHPGVVGFSSHAPSGSFTGLAVTAEPAGGTAAPTGSPVAVGSVATSRS